MSLIYCGACSASFHHIDDHATHLKECLAAQTILLPVTALMFGVSDPSHRAAHLIQCIPKCTSYINDYAWAIAIEMNSWDRSVIHKRLCKKLSLDYSEFRPFEADDIHQIPKIDEAKEIIYRDLKRIILKSMAPKDKDHAQMHSV